MRDSGYRAPLSGLSKLMILLVVCFVLQCIDWAYIHSGLQSQLALRLNDVLHGKIWQLLTYQFLHGNTLHLLLNLLALWFLGKSVAARLGTQSMIALFCLSGVAGGIVHLIAAAIMPAWLGPVVGASAGTSGLLAAFCLFEPNAPLYIYGLIPIRSVYVLYFSLIISAFFTLVPVDGGVAHTAHLGGLLAGMAMARYGVPSWSGLSQLSIRKPRSSSARGVGDPAWKIKSTPSSGGDFVSREIDPILEKISKQGIHSLTDAERKALESARQRMNRR